MDLDLSGAPGLGLEVDWADGKTLLIKSIKASGEWFGEVGSVGGFGWVGFLNEKLVNLNKASFQAEAISKGFVAFPILLFFCLLSFKSQS